MQVGIFGLLGVALIILKLCGVIDWSWWWVLAPWWATLLVTLILFGGIWAGYVLVMIRSVTPRRRK